MKKLLSLLSLLLVVGCQSIQENDKPLPKELRPVLTKQHSYDYYLMIIQNDWTEETVNSQIIDKFNVSEELRNVLICAIKETYLPEYQEYLTKIQKCQNKKQNPPTILKTKQSTEQT